MRRLLIIILLLYAVVGRSQESVIDSLSARLQENLHDTDRVKALNNLAWQLMYANVDTAIILTSEALSVAVASDWPTGIAASNGRLGTFHYLQGDYDKALEHYFISLEMEEEIGNKKGTSSVLGNIGLIYLDQGDYPRALEHFFKALHTDEELDRKSGIAANLGNIGTVYYNQRDYPKSLEYQLKALELDEELKDNYGIASDLTNIGIVYGKQKEFSKALNYFFKALQLFEDMGHKSGVANHLGNIGGLYKNQGDSALAAGDTVYAIENKFPKSLEYLREALKLHEEQGSKYNIARVLGNVGSVYIRIGELKKAEETLQKALSLSREIGAKEYLKLEYKSLSDLFDKTGKPAKAFEAYKLHIIYRDSLDNEENTRAQTRTEMKYEYEKAALVEAQEAKEVARLEAEETARRDNLQYSVILMVLLVIGVLLAVIGRFSIPIKVAEGLIFFSFLIFFEFLLVLADPYIEGWSGGAPGIMLLFNAGIAALIFPLHAFFEAKLKNRLVA